MSAEQCPSIEQLSAFASGDSTELHATSITMHLRDCDTCVMRIQQLEALSDSGSSNSQLAKRLAEFSGEQACRELSAKILSEHPSAAGQIAAQSESSVSGNRQPSPKTLGEYELLDEVGRGGMGVVYKARHRRLDKVVAVKTMSRLFRDDRECKERFEREMKAIGQMDHPNIVRATDAGVIDGTYFLVTEFVEGLTASQLVERHGPLPVADACEIIHQAARGLDEAHRHEMVHRDIKPSNLIVSKPPRPPTR